MRTAAAATDPSAASPSRRRHRLPLLELAGALIVIGVVRKGAFYAPDDLLLPTLAATVAVVGIAVHWRRRVLGRRDWVVVTALLLFSAWWYLVALDHGDWPLTRHVVGSAIGFAACYAIGCTLDASQRRAVRSGAILLGTVTAALGLVGLAFRLDPWALPAQGHLRLAGTLTYSNATGALLAVLAVVAMTAPASRPRNAQLVLIAGGLLATQSRGALLCLLVGLVLLRRQVPDAVVPLGLGALLGAVAVAGSGGPQRHPELLLLAVALAGAAALHVRRTPTRWIAAAAAVVLLALGLLTLTSSGFGDVLRNRTGTASISDRELEWRAAWRDFTASPITGAGPGNRLRLEDGRTARFVHNEPLQVATDSGLIGLGLLLVAAGAAAIPRRDGRRVEGAAAVLAVLLVSGLLDFTWHLPAIAMLAGLLTTGLPLKTERGRSRTPR